MRGGAGFPVRVRFAKRGKIRWISHRDVARAFERAWRVGRLPLAFTEGFSPRPKVSFGLALPVGYESDAEYLDVEMAEEVPLEGLAAAMTAGLPEGLTVTGVAALAGRAPALQEAVTTVAWDVEIVAAGPGAGAPAPAAVEAAVAEALARPTLEVGRLRKGREVVDDVRPAVRHFAVHGPAAAGTRAELEVATHPRGARPGEILAAIAGCVPAAAGFAEGRVVRTHQWIERDGTRQEPLDADPRPRAPEARAS